MRFLTGGYTAEMDGEATGIGMLLAGAADDRLAGGSLGFAGDAVRTGGSPSWIAAHPALDVVYAALEGDGAVQAFTRTGEASFARLGAPVPAGELACHVAVSPDGASLVASCWGDGQVVRMALDAAGRPSSPQTAVAAVDPYAGFGVDDRTSHAHQTRFLRSGRIVTCDMGFDLLRFWRAGARGLEAAEELVLPMGTGPRHLQSHPSGHLYVITELSREVFVLAEGPSGAWRVISGVPLSADPTTAGDTAAELAVSRDGQFLYAGLRGSNTISTLRVRGDGSSLDLVAQVDSGVDWPRHHVVARDTLLVAGQHSNEVASLTLDERTGVPGRARQRTAVPSPTCLLPVA
ncbi:lactonase family protein [Microbacterium kribbense]|uniref:Lactonase family protein n=1 Tax=Microbacterium kribbense TaxID=433645 RepID=A0ABP7G5X6_9MICO